MAVVPTGKSGSEAVSANTATVRKGGESGWIGKEMMPLQRIAGENGTESVREGREVAPNCRKQNILEG
jgi:hypothetical protein